MLLSPHLKRERGEEARKKVIRGGGASTRGRGRRSDMGDHLFVVAASLLPRKSMLPPLDLGPLPADLVADCC